MKRSILLLCVAGLLLAGAPLRAGDTGTYRIVSYRVDLAPHSDGTVAMRYHQKWLVTGGHIPWITVGTANGDFEAAEHGGAVAVLTPENQGGWSGVRLDLDRDYRPGETFEVSFAIVQRGLFHADKESYRLDFTPGWYDRASIDTLRVAVRFFADLATVSADPPATAVAGEEMFWTVYGLGPGERHTIRVSFPVGLFPAGIDAGNLSGASRGVPVVVAVVIILVFLIIVLAVRSAARAGRGRYSGGRIFYGGYPGSASRGGGARSGRSTGGGGGFGGSSISCACACVSCACACACAGGGGAGCARKLEHACAACGRKSGS